MTIKKYGVEEARVDTRPEDNDADTWRRVAQSELGDARRQIAERLAEQHAGPDAED